jgi:surfactin synthase thioesterase subunit
VRDFIPYKIAMRIKAMVQFSTRLDARLEVKDQTKQKEQLEIWERCRTQKLTKIQTIEGEQFARTKKLRAAEKKIKRKLKDRLLRKGLSD